MVKLVEVSKIFPVTLRFRPHGRYLRKRVFLLPREYPQPLSYPQVKAFVDGLCDKFPDRQYVLEDVTIGFDRSKKKPHTLFWRIRKAERDRFYVPIYIHKLNGRVFVPASYVKRRKSRVGRVLVSTLGALGYILPYKD